MTRLKWFCIGLAISGAAWLGYWAQQTVGGGA
jgi:hypothetical protein